MTNRSGGRSRSRLLHCSSDETRGESRRQSIRQEAACYGLGGRAFLLANTSGLGEQCALLLAADELPSGYGDNHTERREKQTR